MEVFVSVRRILPLWSFAIVRVGKTEGNWRCHEPFEVLGSVLDVNLPSQVAEYEGEHCNQLALAALGMQPVLQKPSLVTIQTLHIASIYHAMLGNEASGGESSMEFTWSLVNLAAHLALPRRCVVFSPTSVEHMPFIRL